jgi:hypothetical protein
MAAGEPVVNIVGVLVPDARPVLLAALAVHIAGGLTAAASGTAAALAPKRARRHRRAGNGGGAAHVEAML